MRILLLTGVKEELEPILKRLPTVFDKEIGGYRCVKAPDLVCATTGPGIRRKTETKRILEQWKPDVIVNAGLVGVLREDDELAPGEHVRLGSVIQSSTGMEYPGGPGQDVLVTVPAPVFEPAEKLDLAWKFRARVCDMEAAELLALVGRYPGLSEKGFIVFSKTVGDRPVDHSLFAGEELTRSWNQKSIMEKLKAAVRFPGGPSALVRLRKLRKSALEGLEIHTLAVIRELLTFPESEDPVDALSSTALDSVFLAH